MPIDCEDQELLEGFLTETTELLEKLDDDLVTLEKTPTDSDLLNRIFRSIHTVKGASSFLGFDLLVRVTHKTEDVLNRLRKGELLVTPEIMDVVLEATDLVKTLVSDIKASEIVDREVDETINKLIPLLSEQAAAQQAPRLQTHRLNRLPLSTQPRLRRKSRFLLIKHHKSLSHRLLPRQHCHLRLPRRLAVPQKKPQRPSRPTRGG